MCAKLIKVSTLYLASLWQRFVCVLEWTALPARADTAPADPDPTETSAPDPTTLVAVRSGKINSNRA